MDLGKVEKERDIERMSECMRVEWGTKLDYVKFSSHSAVFWETHGTDIRWNILRTHESKKFFFGEKKPFVTALGMI